ncbi:hypothetical protein LCGC14_1960140, partial [marine sediment metagenome]
TTYGPDQLFAYDNILALTEWWDGGSTNATPDAVDISGGYYSIATKLTIPNAANNIRFASLFIVSTIADALFSSAAESASIEDLTFTALQVRFHSASGTFCNLGSAAINNNSGLFIDGVYGFVASGVGAGGTFITVDTQYLNVHVGDIFGKDFTTQYSGPASSGYGGSHVLLDGVMHTDSVADGVTAGSIIIGNDTPKWDELVISVPGANVLNTLGITNGETVPSWKTVLDGTNPAVVAATASAGTSLVFSHRDHVHALGIGTTRGDLLAWNSTPVASRIGIGSAQTYLRSDGTDPAWSTIPADEVLLPLLGSPTYTHVEQMNTLFHSTGWFSGGTITDAGSATVNVAVGTGAMRASDSTVAQLLFFDWSSASGQAITANSIRYVGVEYNAGSPQVVIRATDNFDATTAFLLGTVVNESGTLHIQNAPWKIGDHASAMIQRSRGTSPIARDKVVGGLIFSESGTRNVVVSAGALWHGLTSFTVSAMDTNPGGAADTFTTYSAGGQEATGVAAWPNTQYDSSGALTNMDNNRWANLWWYLELDAELVMVYGTNQYTSAAKAGEEAAPSTLPNRLQVHGVLAARFIFQKSAGTAENILSAFDTPFSVLGVTDHGNLGGLGDDDHTIYTLKSTLTAQGSIYLASGASTPAELAISAPAANVRNVLGVDNGEATAAWKTALDGTNPAATAATASPGTSLVFAHRDHVHPIGVGTTRGDLLVWNSTPVASRLALGAAGTVLIGGATDPSWSGSPALSGTLTVDTINEFTADEGVE